MEPKKNPEADIHGKRNVIFNFSLALSIFVVFCAFQVVVKTQDKPRKPQTQNEDNNEILNVPITVIKDDRVAESSPKPKTTTPAVTPSTFVAVANTTAASELAETFHLDEPVLDPPQYNSADVVTEPENYTDVFILVENMPEPVGGYQKFFNTIGREIKYPAFARRNDVQGKVFVEFIVNEKGDLTDFKVIKGIGGGCDEEAVRVLALTKWNPGKQRAKPVKVRMMQQISFVLGNN